MFLPMSHVMQYTRIVWVHSYIIVAGAWPEGPGIYTVVVGATLIMLAPLGMDLWWVPGALMVLHLMACVCDGHRELSSNCGPWLACVVGAEFLALCCSSWLVLSSLCIQQQCQGIRARPHVHAIFMAMSFPPPLALTAQTSRSCYRFAAVRCWCTSG